jgi:hypothetical protein
VFLQAVALQEELLLHVPPSAHSTLRYRQGMTLYALAYMCEGLGQMERALQMSLAALGQLDGVVSAPGQPDYETHQEGRAQCLDFLCSLPVESPAGRAMCHS